ncbi:hypothetical protein CN509_15520, partial [Bacillus cereus]
TCSIRYDSVGNIYALFSFVLFLHQNRLFNFLQYNGRKSHRYEKKTVFDILGVVYEYTTSTHQVA